MNALNFNRLIGPLLCAAAFVTGTAPATAADAPTADVMSITVYYGDLNLQKSASIATLYHRIQRAAEYVCQRTNNRDLRQIQVARKCTEESIERAVVSINMPALASYAAR